MAYGTTAYAHAVIEQRRQLANPTTRSGSRQRRRFGRLVGLLAALTILVITGTITAQGDTPPESSMHGSGSDSWASDVHGIYALESGEQLTIFGVGSSTEYELDGYRVGLDPDIVDRFLATDDPAEVVTVVRGGQDEVVGVVLDRPAEPELTAVRQDLFQEETVGFVNGDVQLAGSLLLPMDEGPHPAVVFVHGAEFGNRDTYRLFATHFARRGIAALIYDKRGTGESSGSFSEATFDDLSDDTLAAVGFLQDHAAIDPDQVGLLGWSQGGWILPIAAQSDTVAFLIPVVPSGLNAGTQAAWLSGNLLHLRGLDARSIETARKGWGMMYSTLQLVDAGVMPSMAGVPGFWFHSLDPHLDPYDQWTQVDQPVLAIWGETDCQVPTEDSLPVFQEALRAGGNTDVTMRVFPDASHGIHLVDPCAHELGGMHGHGARFRYAPGFFSVLAEWTLSRPGSGDVLMPDQLDASPLGWHQDPSMDVPWYGTFLPQAAAFVTMVAVFSLVALVRLWGSTFGRKRNADVRTSAPWRLTGITAAAGLAAILLGGVALAELLMLGNVHSGFMVGGPLVNGVSPLSRAASVAAWTTMVLGAALVFYTMRERLGRRSNGPGTSRLTVTMLLMLPLFIGSAAYWGLLSSRLFG
jgi:dienelactone hydrolase